MRTQKAGEGAVARDNGKVRRSRPAQVVTSRRTLEIYTARVQRRVGFAKGVWISAARAIGGRVRRAEQWVMRHRQAPGTAKVAYRRPSIGHTCQPPRRHGRRDDGLRDPHGP